MALHGESCERHPHADYDLGVTGREPVHIDLAARLTDLKVPPGNRLHALCADRLGQHSIAFSDQWRVCFRFVDGDAYDVDVCDYH